MSTPSATTISDNAWLHIFIMWMDILFMEGMSIEKGVDQGKAQERKVNSSAETLSIETEYGNVFVDSSQEDLEQAKVVVGQLGTFKTTRIFLIQEVESTLALATEQNHPTETTLKQLNNALEKCDTIVVLCDRAPLDWLRQRLSFYQITQVKHNRKFRIYVISSQPNSLTSSMNDIHWIDKSSLGRN